MPISLFPSFTLHEADNGLDDLTLFSLPPLRSLRLLQVYLPPRCQVFTAEPLCCPSEPTTTKFPHFFKNKARKSRARLFFILEPVESCSLFYACPFFLSFYTATKFHVFTFFYTDIVHKKA